MYEDALGWTSHIRRGFLAEEERLHFLAAMS